MSDELVAYGAVLWAAAYMGWRLLPGSWRDALGQRCRKLRQRIGLAQVQAATPSQATQARPHGGCGPCTGCASRQCPASTVMITTNKEVRKC
jgi:hypothetical protein